MTTTTTTTTTPALPLPLASFVAAMNAHDSAAFALCFTPDAVVEDESHTYRGTEAIKGWIETAFEKFRPQLEVVNIASHEASAVFVGQVSGTFDGSPVLLRHHVVLDDGRIAALSIAP